MYEDGSDVVNGARPLREHLERHLNAPVMVYGLRSYTQAAPDTGEHLLKAIPARALTTKVMAVRNKIMGQFIEFSCDLRGNFPKELKEKL